MVYNDKISAKQKALAIYLKMESGASYREIAQKCNISKSSAERICKIDIKRGESIKPRSGRPKKINARSSRILLRSLKKCRKTGVNFDVKSLVRESGLSFQLASRRTFSCHLNSMGYKFLQAREKGLLTDNDKKDICVLLGIQCEIVQHLILSFLATKSRFTWTVSHLYTNITPSTQQ